jgi:hypothetical protein
MKLKTLVSGILIIISFFSINGQTYGEKKLYADYGNWSYEISKSEMLSISSFATVQRILSCPNYEQKRKTVASLPKYRYELYLISGSKLNNTSVKTWIFNAKIYINGIEMTFQQFPKGFTALINTDDTLIYWYETDNNRIDIKIMWESSNFNKN